MAGKKPCLMVSAQADWATLKSRSIRPCHKLTWGLDLMAISGVRELVCVSEAGLRIINNRSRR